jgi:hypothetical protein
MVYFKNKVWAGAGYNQNNGLALFFGLNLKDKLKINYGYEFPPFKSGVTATSAHELHMTVTFGKKKSSTFVNKSKPAPSVAKPANDVEEPIEENIDETENVDEATSDYAATDKKENIKTSEPAVTKNPENVKVRKEDVPTEVAKAPAGKPAKSFTIAKGHYVVVGVFSMMDHSTRFTKQLLKEGYDVNVALNPKNKFYYVYIFSTYDLDEARKVRNQYRWKNLFKEAWVFTME